MKLKISSLKLMRNLKRREMNNEEKRRKMRETKITYSPQPTSTLVLITSDRYLQIPGECVHVRRARDYQKCTQDKIPPIYWEEKLRMLHIGMWYRYEKSVFFPIKIHRYLTNKFSWQFYWNRFFRIRFSLKGT